MASADVLISGSGAIVSYSGGNITKILSRKNCIFFFFFFFLFTEHTQVTPGLPMLQRRFYKYINITYLHRNCISWQYTIVRYITLSINYEVPGKHYIEEQSIFQISQYFLHVEYSQIDFSRVECLDSIHLIGILLYISLES